jgi:hypothetical protein
VRSAWWTKEKEASCLQKTRANSLAALKHMSAYLGREPGLGAAHLPPAGRAALSTHFHVREMFLDSLYRPTRIGL